MEGECLEPSTLRRSSCQSFASIWLHSGSSGARAEDGSVRARRTRARLNFTMGIDDAVRAAGFLKAKVCIPRHYDTFDLIKADPAEFVRKAEAKGHHVVVVAPGGTYKVA